MKKMKKTKLAATLAATIGLGAFTGSAQAVNMAPDGVGEMLYIPYYNVNETQENHFQLVNTSDFTVAVKLKFRAGEGSRDVRDFHIIMSPRDVWNGFVRNSGDDNARVQTSDKTCTSPDKPAWTQEADGSFSVSFNNTPKQLFSGYVREGYIQALVMGVSDVPVNRVNSVAYLAKHINGVPRDCASIDAAFANIELNNDGVSGFSSIVSQFKEPMNVLAGSSVQVNVSSGKAYNVPVTAIANFYNPAGSDGQGPNGNNIIGIPGTEQPTENDAFPPVATAYEDTEAKLYTADFVNGVDAVTASMMRDSVMSFFDTSENETRTNWVVNFPTKKFYTSSQDVATSRPFAPTRLRPGEGSTELINWVRISPIAQTTIDPKEVSQDFSAYTDYEEAEGVAPIDGTDFSGNDPTEVIETDVFLPWEVNVVTWNNQNRLKSQLTTNLDFVVSQGWFEMRFNNSHPLTGTSDGDDVVFHGLPVIGFNYVEKSGDTISAGVDFFYTRNIDD